jgi:hypothetical protein
VLLDRLGVLALFLTIILLYTQPPTRDTIKEDTFHNSNLIMEISNSLIIPINSKLMAVNTIIPINSNLMMVNIITEISNSSLITEINSNQMAINNNLMALNIIIDVKNIHNKL